MVYICLLSEKLSFNGFDDWKPEEVVLEIGGQKKTLNKDQPISCSTLAKISSTATVLVSRGFDDLSSKEHLQIKLSSRKIFREGNNCHLVVTSKSGQIQAKFMPSNRKSERRTDSDSPPTIEELTDLIADLMSGASDKKSRSVEPKVYQTLTYVDGRVYKGECKNNIPNGYGIMILPDGAIHKGEFINGLLNGPGEITFRNGFFHKGDFQNGKAHGYAEMSLPGGSILRGPYIEGKPHGLVTIIFPNGKVSIGEYQNGGRIR